MLTENITIVFIAKPHHTIPEIFKRGMLTAMMNQEQRRMLIARMRFHIEPEISCSRFLGEACFTPESIKTYRDSWNTSDLERSELGNFLAERLHGGLFVDVPCGLASARDPNRDFDLIPLVATLGAESYWEVDLNAEVLGDRIADPINVTENGQRYALDGKVGPTGTRTEHGIAILTMQDELLGFLQKIENDMRPATAFYLSGIQPEQSVLTPEGQEQIAVPYLTALYDELARVCRTQDTVILNSSDMLVTGIDETGYPPFGPLWEATGGRPTMHPVLALAERGLSLRRRCAFDKVHVFAQT